MLACARSVMSVGFEGFHFGGIKEPEWVGTRSLAEQEIEQYLDHFDHCNNQTWNMVELL